jgi:hypothetical protein
MSPNKARVQQILEINFGKSNIRHTDKGFKVNRNKLTSEEIKALANVYPVSEDMEIKRSGTGVLLVVTLNPEDREG